MVAAGGDGTVHRVVNRLARRAELDRPIAVLPAGTGNDLARGCGLALDPVEVANGLRHHVVRPMTALAVEGRSEDLGDAAIDRWAVNNVHLGVGIEAADVADGLKPRIGHLAYPVGTVVRGMASDGIEIVIEVDTSPIFDGRALAVVVATGPSGGGGHEIAADASPHAPGVEVVVVPLTSVAGRLRLAAGAIRRPLSELPNVITAMGTEVSLRGADLRIDVDGERYDAGDTVQLTAMTRAWSLLVPDGAHTGAQTEATDRAD